MAPKSRSANVFALLTFAVVSILSHPRGATSAVASQSEAAAASASKRQSVDEILLPWDRPDEPGLAIAVLDSGEVVYRRNLGSASLEHGLAITPSTVFQAASLAKQFTGMAIALLASRGQIALDDEIQRYLPQVPEFDQPVTVRHLLHHTSGLRDQWELLLLAGWNYEDLVTQEHVWSLVRRQRTLNFPPGSEYLYTNTGYTLLADVVETVSDRPFRRWMREEIFLPLGMSSTRIVDDVRAVVDDRAYSYFATGDGGFERSATNVATYGATNLFTTVDDLLRWVRGLEEATLVERAVIDRAQTSGSLNDGQSTHYAFGWRVTDDRGLRVLMHGGGQGGYRAFLIHFPDRRLAVALLANLSTVPVGSIARQVAEIYLDDLPPKEPRKPVEEDHSETPTIPYRASREELDSLVGSYRCDEIGATYDLVVQGDELTLDDPRKGPMPLSPLARDRFEEDMSDEFGISRPWMRTFEFERTHNGEVSGFRLSVGSAQNLRFKKLATGSLDPSSPDPGS